MADKAAPPNSSSRGGKKARKNKKAKADGPKAPQGMRFIDARHFLKESKMFIELERKSEVDATEALLKSTPKKELEVMGVAITKLSVMSSATGLYGRLILTLGRNSGPKNAAGEIDLPSHKFGPGSIVCLIPEGIDPRETAVGAIDEATIRGVVFKSTTGRIQIALDAPPEMDLTDALFTLTLMTNDVTFKRMDKALEMFEAIVGPEGDKVSDLPKSMQVVFGAETNEVDPAQLKEDFTPINPGLNDSQIDAIKFALASKHLTLIHGPPGTGKTSTIVELINQAVLRLNLKILACAPSNVAVDNIAERLGASKTKVKLVRLGHPARILPAAKSYSIDDVYRDSNSFEVVKAIVEDMDKLQKEIDKTRNYNERRTKRVQWREMRADLKRMQAQGMQQIVKDANVVLATCTGAFDKHIRNFDGKFDMVIIDEAGQGLDPLVLLPMLQGKKLVLAGDHLQLPPTITSTAAVEKSLGTSTFFERLIYYEALQHSVPETSETTSTLTSLSSSTSSEISDVASASGTSTTSAKEKPRPKRPIGEISRLLTVQYRMNEVIMKFASQQLYENKLVSADAVRGHTLADLKAKRAAAAAGDDGAALTVRQPIVSELDDLSKYPLILIDTAGLDLHELGGVNDSKLNEGEADIVVALVKKLLSATGTGLEAKDVGIIAPYNAQVDLLRNAIRLEHPGIEINSVDSFQGREKEAIIMTLVRSNPNKDIGFLKSDQRTNVAITRARRCLIIVTDTDTTSAHPFLKQLFDYCADAGEVWSGAEFQPEVSHYTPAAFKVKGTPTTSKKTPKKETSPEPTQETASSEPKASDGPESTEGAVAATVPPKELAPASTEATEPKVTQEPKDEPKSEVAAPQPAVGGAPETRKVETPANESTSPRPGPNVPATVSTAITNQKPSGNTQADQLAEYREKQRQQAVEEKKAAKHPPPAAASAAPAPGAGKKKKGLPPPASAQPALPPSEKDAFKKLSKDGDVLDAVLKFQGVCHAPNCKEKTLLIYSDCHYCKERFCMRHATAELHGCGDAAKQAARQKALAQAKDIKKLGTQEGGGGLPDWKRSALSDKLQKKIGKAQDQRNKKPAKK